MYILVKKYIFLLIAWIQNSVEILKSVLNKKIPYFKFNTLNHNKAFQTKTSSNRCKASTSTPAMTSPKPRMTSQTTRSEWGFAEWGETTKWKWDGKSRRGWPDIRGTWTWALNWTSDCSKKYKNKRIRICSDSIHFC